MFQEIQGGSGFDLLAHLGELRTRLGRATIAVLLLGSVSLAFAEEIFHILMLPVLRSLPEGQRSLVQTSAIEELNTFFKVGLYAGIFFSAPVILYQIWCFVAPGLYASERRMAAPFVAAGTVCFLLGGAFCYFAVLPPAFDFLLRSDRTRSSQSELEVARGALDDAERLLLVGELDAASQYLESADQALALLPEGMGAGRHAQLERVRNIDKMLDATMQHSERGSLGSLVREVVHLRNQARAASIAGDQEVAMLNLTMAEKLVRRAYSRAWAPDKMHIESILERHADLVTRASAIADRIEDDNWTRPMLSMREQLNLVLLLVLVFGFIFEIPIVFALLASLGLITGERLASSRKYAIVAILFLAAVITPTGDPFNLALMAIPMIICYEVGVIAARVISSRRKARRPDTGTYEEPNGIMENHLPVDQGKA